MRCITANGKILKQSRDHNHAPFVGDMSSCCWNWYSSSLHVYKIWRLLVGSTIPMIRLEPPKFLMSHISDPTTPLSRTVCRLQAVTCTFNLYIKFEVFTITEDAHCNAKYRNWGGLKWLWVTQGHRHVLLCNNASGNRFHAWYSHSSITLTVKNVFLLSKWACWFKIIK